VKVEVHCEDAWHAGRPPVYILCKARWDENLCLEEERRTPESLGIAVRMPLIFQDGPPAGDQPPTQGRAADMIDAIERYREAGASHLVFDFVPESLATALDTMERFAEEVRPKIASS